MQVLFAILIAGGLVGLNVWLMIENKKTPVPAGCENLKPECGGCGIADCELRRNFEKNEPIQKGAEQ